MKTPWPYFGGKLSVAADVWRRFGDVSCYVEPFFGSGAILLNRPPPIDGVETVNDKDGFIANFFRAVKNEPEKVAFFADREVNECDLHAVHIGLVNGKESLQRKLEGDENWFDAEVAGKWCWGMCCWIGSGFCSGDGPWQVVDGKLVHLSSAGMGVNRQLVHLGDAGMGVNRKLVHLGAGRGVNRKLVHLGNAGVGVNRQRVHLSGAGMGVNRKRVHLGDAGIGVAGDGERGIYAWMAALANRLARVRVCCGDWRRVCGGSGGDALRHFFACGNACAMFLDPPYSAEAGRDNNLYVHESLDVARDVRDWAVAHGGDKRLRIALCGYEGEHDMPDDWECFKWKAQGGYSLLGRGAESQAKVNAKRERIWFSPHCMKYKKIGFFT